MKIEQKRKLKKENLMYLQRKFYKFMEKHPGVFKINTILYMWKRKSKDPTFDHEKLISNIVYFPEAELKDTIK